MSRFRLFGTESRDNSVKQLETHRPREEAVGQRAIASAAHLSRCPGCGTMGILVRLSGWIPDIIFVQAGSAKAPGWNRVWHGRFGRHGHSKHGLRASPLPWNGLPLTVAIALIAEQSHVLCFTNKLERGYLGMDSAFPWPWGIQPQLAEDAVKRPCGDAQGCLQGQRRQQQTLPHSQESKDARSTLIQQRSL